MATLQIEVGKTYITKSFNPEDTNPNHRVKILGICPDFTHEFKIGYPFYGDNERCYRDDGVNSTYGLNATLPPDLVGINPPTDEHCLVAEAIQEDFILGYEQRLIVDLSLCERSDKYRELTSDKGQLCLGGLYINRMGFMKLVDRTFWHGDEAVNEYNHDDMTFEAGGILHYSNGRTEEPWLGLDRLTMKDFIYQLKLS